MNSEKKSTAQNAAAGIDLSQVYAHNSIYLAVQVATIKATCMFKYWHLVSALFEQVHADNSIYVPHSRCITWKQYDFK